jgi:uncharacterized protein DUF4304
MDSSVVNKEIKSVIRPLLQFAGFAGFTSRTAWRYSQQKIDVINFQSFNSFLATGVGCTTYSFAVNLGCSFDAIPRSERIKRKNGSMRPEEYECHFRRALQKSIHQPKLKRGDIWYVDPSGENLESVIADAKKAIDDIGLPWFEQFNDLNEVLRTLVEDSEAHESTWGFGAKPSPNRNIMTGFVALALGKTTLARTHIQKALDSGCLREFEARMRAALQGMPSSPA